MPRVRPRWRVGFVHSVHGYLATVAWRHVAGIIAYLAKLVKWKKLNVGLVSCSCFAHNLLLFNLFPKFGIDSKSLHLVSYFLHHVTWGIWHATDVLHALEFFTEVFFYRFDEVV